MYHRHFRVRSRRLLGSTYEQIRNLIDALSHLSVDALFGRGCQVVNTIFGDLQNPVAPGFAGFIAVDRVPTIPQRAAGGHYRAAHLVHPLRQRHAASTATVPGIVTTNLLQVSYVPGKGYVYGVDLGGVTYWWSRFRKRRWSRRTRWLPHGSVSSHAPFPATATHRESGRPVDQRRSHGGGCIWRTHRGGLSPPDCNAWVAIHW